VTNTRQATAGPTGDSAAATRAFRAEDVLTVLANRLHGHAIIATDLAGRVQMWNAGAEGLSDLVASEAIGRNIATLGLPGLDGTSDQVFHQARVNGVFETQGWWEIRERRYWIDLMVAPLFSPAGEATGFLTVVQDRSDYLRWEEERNAALEREADVRSSLRAAERSAAFLAEATSILAASSLEVHGTVKSLARLAVSRLADWCVVYTIGADRKVRRSEVAHRSPEREELMQQLLATPLQPRRKHPVLAVIRTGLPELAPNVTEDMLRIIAGSPNQLDALRELGMSTAMFAPLIARGRVLGGIVFAGIDPARPFTEEDLRLADELARRAAIAIDNARLYADAQDANRAKSDFLAIVSHELRTPLNAIMGYADLIDSGISGQVSEKQRQQLGRVRASARHLLQLIEEILSFARLESGGTELELESTTIEALAEDVTALIEPLSEGKSLALNVEVQDGATIITTDVGKARQILVNLLSNAVKFTRQGTVTLAAHVEKQHVLFEVRDTGIGIDPEVAHRIFDPFWQAEKPNTRRVGGTGLGLSIARRFASLLNGDIRLDSQVGRGSSFTLRLPLQPKKNS